MDNNDDNIIALQAHLALIRDIYETEFWNRFQRDCDENPFANTAHTFACNDAFISAYEWNDEENDGVNFRYKGLAVSWYKYFPRGLYYETDEEITVAFLAEMVRYYRQAIHEAPNEAFLDREIIAR